MTDSSDPSGNREVVFLEIFDKKIIYRIFLFLLPKLILKIKNEINQEINDRFAQEWSKIGKAKDDMIPSRKSIRKI